MQPPARQVSTCPTCGAALEETAGGGLGCTSCLLQAGISGEQETVHDSTRDAPEGGIRFGVYEIDCHADGSLCELGRGAMGVTYRATDTSLQRKVALKIIKTDIASEAPMPANALSAKRARLQHCDTKTSLSSTSSECVLRQVNIFTRWN